MRIIVLYALILIETTRIIILTKQQLKLQFRQRACRMSVLFCMCTWVKVTLYRNLDQVILD